MSFQAEAGVLRSEVHFRSPSEKVFEAPVTDAGRARFWAEAAQEIDGVIAQLTIMRRFSTCGVLAMSAEVLNPAIPHHLTS